ncbi:PTO1314 family radical SAM protein [Candidatus Bathyarchaeota archaeon]|nr:PTO1314 family radical SAM protein [Candidatus Bathyarchaeota archaeon]
MDKKRSKNYFSAHKGLDYYLGLLSLGVRLYKGLFLNSIGLKSPIFCGHKVTYRCNLRCVMCPFWKRKEPELTLKEEKKILVKLRQAGVCLIAFEGGEPLLREDIAQILAFSRSLGMHISLVTNGMLLKARVDEIAEYINGVIYVSIDGLEHTHDKIRGVRGCFKNAIEGIIACKNKAFVTINTTMIQENVHEIEDLVKLAKELDVGISLTLAYEYKDACVSTPPINDLRQTINRLIRMKKEGYPIVNSISYLKVLLGAKSWKCKPWTVINVSPKGDVIMPCYVRQEYESYASLLHKDVKEIWKKYNWEEVKNCNACYLHCYVEPSLILSFDLGAYFNWMRRVRC